MKYTYTAESLDGRQVEGSIEAENTAAVLAFLAGKGLRPVAIKKVTEGGLFAKNIFGGGITIVDQIFLVRYLALMLRVGVDLLRVIDVLIADFDKPSLKSFLLEVRETVEKGQPFYSAFAKYPRYFSPVFVSLIKAGELSGNLEPVFENLSASLERERDFKSRVSAALVYPAFVAGIALFILIFLVVFALPRISGVFANSNFTPPLFSRIVFAVGAFLNQYIFFFLGGFALLGLLLWYFVSFTGSGRAALRRFIAAVPVLREVYKKITLQEFTASLSSLMKAGLPIIEALHITAGVGGYPGVEEAIVRIADDGVAKGLTLGAAFKKEEVFPKIVTNLIAISEKAGHIDEVLQTLSKFFETEVDASLKKLISFVEPIMLLIIGGIVGLIALSIILPVYQLVAQF